MTQQMQQFLKVLIFARLIMNRFTLISIQQTALYVLAETGIGLRLWLGLVFIKIKRAVCWVENSANLMNHEKP